MRLIHLMRHLYAGVYALNIPYVTPYAASYAVKKTKLKARIPKPLATVHACKINIFLPRSYLSFLQAMPDFSDEPSPFREWLRAADAAISLKGFNARAL